ncbi:hypothetical protein AAEO50_10345 [Rossellomorea oryzaecorticis]|uniref:Uncharacterized protein n=1 Tax=Rossellomorea oryzaecorticis TaxID=1396505 RepID=A0ABU9KA99_9BACI
MLPKQDIMLKLAEIEESLNQLEQSVYDRISMEEKVEGSKLSGKIEELEDRLSIVESRAEAIINRREHSYLVQKLELSYKTS